jgi:membrane protein implicated in regulation of membrane protease activity
VNKAFTIIQLAIIAGIVVYCTVCLYRGNFEGAYVTFPFLLFYYVWVVARRRRKENPEKSEDQ